MSIRNSSVGRKVIMALSGIFLILFLALHFTVNLTSVFSEDVFNELSHFMGTNFFVQFIAQPILIFGVIFHFVLGFILELKNASARSKKYSVYKGSANASWVSRNMIYSGIVVLAFLGLHLYDFWLPEIKYKYIEVLPEDQSRYFEEMTHRFHNLVRVILYSISFIFLMLHLLHGFNSSFQSLGVNNRYSVAIRKATEFFAIVVPLGFIFIAFFHYTKGL